METWRALTTESWSMTKRGRHREAVVAVGLLAGQRSERAVEHVLGDRRRQVEADPVEAQDLLADAGEDVET